MAFLSEQPTLELTDSSAKEMLGPQVFDPSEEQRSEEKAFLPGQCNILSTSGFSGNVLMVECVYDPLGE